MTDTFHEHLLSAVQYPTGSGHHTKNNARACGLGSGLWPGPTPPLLLYHENVMPKISILKYYFFKFFFFYLPQLPMIFIFVTLMTNIVSFNFQCLTSGKSIKNPEEKHTKNFVFSFIKNPFVQNI